MKTSGEDLAKEIAADFNTYLRRGVNFDPYTEEIDPNLNINEVEKLLRIHFVLTESSDESPGVIDFTRKLRRRVRRIKTTVSKKTEELEGEIRGRIDWGKTIQTRSRDGFQNKTKFACQQTQKNYEVPENLVLKKLLSVIHNIVSEDLKPALEEDTGYGWLEGWVAGDGDEDLVQTLKDVFLRNVYLSRVDTEGETVTDRTINSVKKSRTKLYREAAKLLERYRKLMDYEVDPAEAEDLLKNTYIKPEKTEVLFEFYWLFQVLNSYDDVKFNLVEGENNAVAEWEDEQFLYRIYHDSTGSLSFQENLEGVDLPEEDGYLYRQGKVVEKWQEMAQEFLGVEGTDQLWGGRPDILLEKYKKNDSNRNQLTQIFIGEVKYTKNRDYAAQGLKELLEYLAFVKDNSDYFEDKFSLFDSPKIWGALFTDELDIDEIESSNDKVFVKQYDGDSNFQKFGNLNLQKEQNHDSSNR